MSNATNIRTGRHVVFMMHVHLVFVTKYRKCVFSKDMLNCLHDTFSSVCTDFDAQLQEFDGEKDHVHLLISYQPKTSVSKMVNSLKGVSSRILKKQFSKEISNYLWKSNLWSPSYFAGSCGGASLNFIKEYIKNQETPLS